MNREIAFSDACSIVKEFLYYMQTIKGRSPKTVEAYYIDIRTFFRYLKMLRGLADDCPFESIATNDIDISFIKSITQADVYEYLYFVTQERENGSATRARKVSTLKSFFKYLTTTAHLLETNPFRDLEIPTIKKALPKFLSLDQSISLLEHVKKDGYFQRNYCIVTLFLNCGMRVSELININLNDINDNTLRITGKGNKERLIYLNDACMASLRDYFPVRANNLSVIKDIDALFLSRLGNRISKRQVQQIVEDTLASAGLSNQGLSTHKLRHTAATLMYQYGGVDIRVLSEILGHEHVSTTEIYTHVSNTQVETAMNKSPLAHVKKEKESDHK